MNADEKNAGSLYKRIFNILKHEFTFEERIWNEIWTMGENDREIMEKENEPLDKAEFFEDSTRASTGDLLIQWRDSDIRANYRRSRQRRFWKCLLDRLKSDGVDVSHVIENPKSYRMCDCNIFWWWLKIYFSYGEYSGCWSKAPQKMLDGVRYFHVMGCSCLLI